MLEWWGAEKSELANSHINAYVKSQLQRVDEAVLRVVLSRSDFDWGTVSENVNRFTNECREHQYVPFASSLLLLHDSEQSVVETVSQSLLSGLLDDDYNTASRAIDTIVFWEFYAHVSRLPAPPSALIDRLIEKILMLENPALERACFALSKLIREIPDNLSKHNFDTIERALEKMAKESKIPSFERFDAELANERKIPLNQRPNLQYAGADLAASLYTRAKKSSLEPSEVVLEWRELCDKTIFPEIRQVSWE